jgi:meiosis induction protein kinase IME2/SME1
MAISHEYSLKGTSHSAMTLEDRFEVIKEVGDGSFGSVVLARTRTAGSNVARRGTMVSVAAVIVIIEDPD